jgi:hypothetical protein
MSECSCVLRECSHAFSMQSEGVVVNVALPTIRFDSFNHISYGGDVCVSLCVVSVIVRIRSAVGSDRDRLVDVYTSLRPQVRCGVRLCPPT